MVGVAQLVEHRVVVAGVAGSSPVAHPKSKAPDRDGRGPSSSVVALARQSGAARLGTCPAAATPTGSTRCSARGSPAGWRGATASGGWARPSATWWSSSPPGAGGATVLEIGGGVGEIQLELLQRGAARDDQPRAGRGLRRPGRASWRARPGSPTGSSAGCTTSSRSRTQVERADVVVLHRVVCCYPDYERLLGAAADHAGRLLVFSHPPRNLVSRAFSSAQNAVPAADRPPLPVVRPPTGGDARRPADHGLTAVHSRRAARSGTWRGWRAQAA